MLFSEDNIDKYRIGYTCGVYDLLHVGHLNLFERCKEYCDILIVGVCNDDYVRTVKGHEPVIDENSRLRMVQAIGVVDGAYLIDIEQTNDKLAAWNLFHFDVLFSGDDWKGSERYKKTEEQFKELSASIIYLPYTKGVSTTEIRTQLSQS